MTTKFWEDANEYLMYTGVPPVKDIIVKTQGTRLYTENGSILDFTSGQMSALLGHCHPEVAECVSYYASNLDHLLSNMITEPVVSLAKNLAAVLPPSLSKSFFLNTGSESTEAALKMAKVATKKFEIVAFGNSYHGLTQGASGATYSVGRKNGVPTVPGMIVFPTPNKLTSPFKTASGDYDWQTEMDFAWSLVDAQSVGSLAAFILEPILSSGGMLVLPDGYLARLSAECKARDMLLILDEAQTGVGRTGNMFAFEKHGVIPDILCLSKTLGAGLPLASVTTTDAVAKQLTENKFIWLTTHMNDPLVAAVGNKVLEIVVRDNLAKNAAERGSELLRGLNSLKDEFDCVLDVRGEGLFCGLELTNEGDLGQLVSDAAMVNGLSCNIVRLPNMANVFRIAPPLTVTAEEIQEGIDILRKSISEVLKTKAN
ncbi:hypothetical protein DASB73_036540 [Starmerella bacillaris]|uniref:Acetylornithine aminotransferase, mitochondrial n=1 Tax=Starmerella bacillaris TaxID=1247836 RepID=A0AAV5RPU9_STABA|nr:hypothetical protein DASB73_036540 [Starmerella bacillaris]